MARDNGLGRPVQVPGEPGESARMGAEPVARPQHGVCTALLTCRFRAPRAIPWMRWRQDQARGDSTCSYE